MNNQGKVADFYDTLGISPLKGLCASLIEEEFDEWKAEYLQDTREPQLKELADLLFTCYGYAESIGEELDYTSDALLYYVDSLPQLIEVEFDNWKGAYLQGDVKGSIKHLERLVSYAYSYADTKYMDLEEAFDRVYQNNKGRCIQEDGSIKLREDGKVLRRKDYPKVYLGDLV